MDITITPKKLSGRITAIPSKSQAHRLLICAAFAERETFLHCPDTNRDIEATAQCLRALGAAIQRTEEGYRVSPVRSIPSSGVLPCHDSGSTLRFLLPMVGALGVDATFQMEGRLPQRPLSPLWEEMERMGCQLSRPTENTLRCQGKLKAGDHLRRGFQPVHHRASAGLFPYPREKPHPHHRKAGIRPLCDHDASGHGSLRHEH